MSSTRKFPSVELPKDIRDFEAQNIASNPKKGVSTHVLEGSCDQLITISQNT
jgi:hypothetical protein